MFDLPPTFDYDTYLSISKSVGMFWFMWQAPGETGLRVERHYPERLTEGARAKLQKLHEWANRTDPDRELRKARVMMEWAERKPGEDVVSPFWQK